jgi:hypothetical protein
MPNVSRVPALAGILHEVGFNWATSDEICCAVDKAGHAQGLSDDVASALFAWRKAFAVGRLTSVRKKAEEFHAADNGEVMTKSAQRAVQDAIDEDVQLALFNTADERRRATGANLRGFTR